VTDVEAFVTDLVKGNPRNLELLLNTRLVYASQQWTELAALAPALVTRRAVAQYAGGVMVRVGDGTGGAGSVMGFDEPLLCARDQPLSASV
jgi:hypothetical protein